MPDTPVVGVVIVNWNGAEDTVACLESVADARPRPDRIVVVDNGSRDDSVERIVSWATLRGLECSLYQHSDTDNPRIGTEALTIIVSSTNRGFSGGNNIGLRLLQNDARVTHFLLLNNDATVAPDFFEEVRAALAVRPDAGLMGVTIFEHPARNKVWYAGGHEIRSRALIVHDRVVPNQSVPLETEFVTGCAMLIAREVANNLGLLPECYFPLYHEDAEYSLRARAAGRAVLYAPRIKAYHRVGGAVGSAAASPLITRAQIRHRILYVRRNFHGLDRAVALAYLAATKPARAIVEALRGRIGISWAILRGTFEGLSAQTT